MTRSCKVIIFPLWSNGHPNLSESRCKDKMRSSNLKGRKVKGEKTVFSSYVRAYVRVSEVRENNERSTLRLYGSRFYTIKKKGFVVVVGVDLDTLKSEPTKGRKRNTERSVDTCRTYMCYCSLVSTFRLREPYYLLLINLRIFWCLTIIISC